jgi:pimeloyl-ACP methyl ester carboxylesterase
VGGGAPHFGDLGYRAIAVDIPGHGNSFRPVRQPSELDYAAMMHTVVKAMGIGPCHLIGHHFGATIAGVLAAEYADNARSLSVYGWPKVSRALLKSFDNARPCEFSADGAAVNDH